MFLNRTNLLPMLAIILLTTSCIKFDKKQSSLQSHGVSNSIKLLKRNPFSGSDKLATAFAEVLSPIRQSEADTLVGLDKDSVWAMSNCQCTTHFGGVYLQKLAQARGALPQALVPAIREEVKNNPALKILLSLPGAFTTLAGKFINDEKVDEQVRDGLNKKLNNALKGGSKLGEKMPYTFNFFPQPFKSVGNTNASLPKIVDINEQASKWAFIGSLENMWGTAENTKPLALDDHGLQLLMTASAMSEWTYAFSLDENDSGDHYGGLAIDPSQGLNSKMSGYHAEKDKDRVGVITGTYTPDFPNEGSLKLATSVVETWTHNSTSISLEEQAKVWTAAAKFYNRLRPSSRTAEAQSIFAPDTGMLPEDAHTLSLNFLPGLAALLNGPFINSETRVISQYANVAGSEPSTLALQADLQSLSKMARSLHEWLAATKSIQNDKLSAGTENEIASSINTMTDALRLSIQAIIDNHIEDSVPNTKLNSIAMVQAKLNFSQPSLEAVAESLAIMTEIDQTTLSAESKLQTDFQKKLVGLFHWFATEYLEEIANGNPKHTLTPAGIIWSHRALLQFSKYDEKISNAKWLKDALRNTELAVTAWDETFK